MHFKPRWTRSLEGFGVSIADDIVVHCVAEEQHNNSMRKHKERA